MHITQSCTKDESGSSSHLKTGSKWGVPALDPISTLNTNGLERARNFAPAVTHKKVPSLFTFVRKICSSEERFSSLTLLNVLLTMASKYAAFQASSLAKESYEQQKAKSATEFVKFSRALIEFQVRGQVSRYLSHFVINTSYSPASNCHVPTYV
jgi:hypothetical protein